MDILNKFAELLASDPSGDFVPQGMEVLRETGEDLDCHADDLDDEQVEEAKKDLRESLISQAGADRNTLVGVYVTLDEEAYSRECSQCEVYESHTAACTGVAVSVPRKGAEAIIKRETVKLQKYIERHNQETAVAELNSVMFSHAKWLTEKQVLAEFRKYHK